MHNNWALCYLVEDFQLTTKTWKRDQKNHVQLFIESNLQVNMLLDQNYIVKKVKPGQCFISEHVF